MEKLKEGIKIISQHYHRPLQLGKEEEGLDGWIDGLRTSRWRLGLTRPPDGSYDRLRIL